MFEDASPVTASLAHRHALLGGVSGAGKSGFLNAALATLTGCPDVMLWGVDLKGSMELGPWAACLGWLATTPAQATELLADAVAVLEARVARRGRAVAISLLVTTQRPTQKAMGSGAVRSQMDVRVCLRVRERRDVDLVLGQGTLAAGWHAHTLDAPGKFLISTPEHTTPRRSRAYLLTDAAVTVLTARHAAIRPGLDPTRDAADTPSTPASVPVTGQPTRALPRPRSSAETLDGQSPGDGAADPDEALLTALRQAPGEGASVPDLMAATDMRRTWVYDRLQDHATDGDTSAHGTGDAASTRRPASRSSR